MIFLPSKKLTLKKTKSKEQLLLSLKTKTYNGTPSIIKFYKTQKEFSFYGEISNNNFSIIRLISFKKNKPTTPIITGEFSENSSETIINLKFEYPNFRYLLFMIIKIALLFYYGNLLYLLIEKSKIDIKLVIISPLIIYIFVVNPILYWIELNRCKKRILNIFK